MEKTPEVPKAKYAVIGGSSTYSLEFPEDVGYPGVEVLEKGLVFETPFGESPAFTLFRVGDKKALSCKMHGWRAGVLRAIASKQIFWVLRDAGVERVLGEGGVGAIDPKLELRDILIPDDYIDFSQRKDVSLESDYLLVMRDALCEEERTALLEAARSIAIGRVFERGVYAVTEGRHFESPAEVRMLRLLGADVVGQSLAPEVYLAREIGACYGSVQIVVNYAEGVVEEWSHEELAEIFFGKAGTMGRILLEALDALPSARGCRCAELRKPTLLR